MMTATMYSDAGPSARESMRVDCRVRLLLVAVASVASLLLVSLPALALLACASFIYLSAQRRWRMQLICYAMLLIMAGLSVLFIHILGLFMPMMRQTGVVSLIVPFLRMAVVFHAVMALALCVRLQDVLGFLRSMRMPRFIYLPLSVTIRFLPGLVHDVRQLRDCLKVRGYHGIGLLRPRLWLIPLLFRTLHLTDELAIAAELKGIGYGKPVPRKGASLLNVWNIGLAMAAAAVIAVTCAVEVQFRNVPGMSGASMHSAMKKDSGMRHGCAVVPAKTDAEAAHD